MNDEIKNDAIVTEPSEDILNKKIVAQPKEERKLGIDTKGTVVDNIVNATIGGTIDMSQIEAFSGISQNRDTVYALLDTMAEDPTIAAVLETYTEDATETNSEGKVLWCESLDPEVTRYVSYLLDTIGVDKNIYRWVNSLCKYGDIYLRLYRESDYNDTLFDDKEDEDSEGRLKSLNESMLEDENQERLDENVNVVLYKKHDKYVHYIEMVPNPAEMYELTRFGKSYAYVHAEVKTNTVQKNDTILTPSYRYKFKRGDIDIYDPTNFVHAALEDNTPRVPEEVSIFRDENTDDPNVKPLTYTVRRGQSLLYSAFKIWRELMLLENSVLLNRITKSSIVRVVSVNVGDMPKEQIGPHLQGIKSLIEQKSALNAGNSLTEYTNPGPVENNIYIPTHGETGSITISSIGGDVDVKGLGDLDYFRDKLFGALKVPKQMFGFTDDSSGFNGGTSLSIISSRYAKTVKRIQNTIIQALTDAINLMLLDKGLSKYINKFQLKMTAPTTQEELDRRESLNSKVGIAGDIMNVAGDVTDPINRLKMLKALLSTCITEQAVIAAVQEEIDRLEKEAAGVEEPSAGDSADEESADGLDIDFGGDVPGGGSDFSDLTPPPSGGDSPATDIQNTEEKLPSPADLGGIDFTDNSQF